MSRSRTLKRSASLRFAPLVLPGQNGPGYELIVGVSFVKPLSSAGGIEGFGGEGLALGAG